MLFLWDLSKRINYVILCKEYLSELIKQKVDDVDINRILVFFKMIDSDDEVKKSIQRNYKIFFRY